MNAFARSPTAAAEPSPRRSPENVRRSIALACLESIEDIAAELAQHLGEQVPELGGSAHAVLSACRANTESILLLLAQGQLDAAVEGAPAATLMYTREAVQRGVPLDALLRAIQLGHAFMSDWWSEQIGENGGAEGVAALRSSSSLMFEHFDRICEGVAAAYREAEQEWTRSAEARRLQTVQEILAGESDDVTALSARLGYDLGGDHVAALLWCSEQTSLSTLKGAAWTAAQACESRMSLIVAPEESRVWVWCSDRERSSASVLKRLEGHVPTRGVWLAIGAPGGGLAGFRRSHADALRAKRLACLGRSRATTSYRATELACLLAHDRESLRRFVIGQLGGLAAQDDATARIRATLRIFFEEGGRQKRAASRLGIHPNTVAYRLQQAEKLRGHPIDCDRLELEVALLACTTVSDRLIG